MKRSHRTTLPALIAGRMISPIRQIQEQFGGRDDFVVANFQQYLANQLAERRAAGLPRRQTNATPSVKITFKGADLRGLTGSVSTFERDQPDHQLKEWRKRREDANSKIGGRRKRCEDAWRRGADALGFAFTQKQIDAVDQLGARKRLGDVIVGAKLIAAQNVFILYLRGEQDHRNRSSLILPF